MKAYPCTKCGSRTPVDDLDDVTGECPVHRNPAPVVIDPDRRSCEICGKAIYGRSDRRTCGPTHQKALQRRKLRGDG